MHKFKLSISLKDLTDLLGTQVQSVLQPEVVPSLVGVSSLGNSSPGEISFCNKLGAEGIAAINNSRASVIFCLPELSASISNQLAKNACLIVVTNPRLAFLRILGKFFTPFLENEIHSTAVIHPEASIGPNVHIGPHCFIGKSTIGEGTRLLGNNYIYDGVRVGKFCNLKPGAVIGGDGFGYEVNEKKTWEKFPHLGSVILEDYVEIGSNTCIDRGVLDDTVIRTRAKIDNLVHIAHNCEIKEDSLVIALSMIGGSVRIGKNCWIAPSSTILNGIKIGNNAFIGLGVTLTSDVADDHRVTPLPSTKIKRKLEP